MSHVGEVIDWVVRGLVALGIPGLSAKFLYDLRQARGSRRKTEAEADVEAAIVPDKVRASSILTREAEVLALQKAFDAEREIKDGVIVFLQEQLGGALEREKVKDEKIRALEARVEQLQTQLRSQADELVRIADELKELQISHG